MRRQTILRELAVFAFFALLTIVFTWPLAVQMKTTVSDFGDPLLTTFVLDWVDHALLHQPLHLFDAPMFHPGILPLAYSENLVAVALLVLPFHLFGLAPLVIHNIAFLLAFTLSGYGAYVLARMVTRNTIAAIVGGIFYAFCSFKFDHLSHIQILFSGWVPLLLAALLAFWRKPSWKRGALLTLALVANGLTNIYFLLFAGVAIVFTVILLAIVQPRSWRFYIGLGWAALAAVVLLYPFLRPYEVVSKTYHYTRNFDEVRNGSATWTNWMVPGRASRVYGHIAADKVYEPERQLFPGLMIVFLAIVAFVATPRREHVPLGPDETSSRWNRALDLLIFLALGVAWAAAMSDRFEFNRFGHRILSMSSSDVPLMVALLAAMVRFRKPLQRWAERSRFSAEAWAAAVWVLVGVLGSFGANSPLYVFFYRRFEPFQAMRVPARFAIIAYAGLAVWGALGVKALLEKREGWRKHVLAALLLALIVVEVRPSIRWEHVREDVPPVYPWLKQVRLEPVVEIPFSGDGTDYQYLYFSHQHRMKLVNGTSGFFPPAWWKLRDADAKIDYDRLLTGLEGIGTKLMIVHGDLLPTYERHKLTVDFLRRNIAAGRLQFVRRFDNEVFGDYVFAITKNLPQWQRYRAAEVPDGAGRLPGQELERFFAYQSTDNHIITIWTQSPQPYETVKGALNVKGWTVSPYGARRVTVLIENGKLRFDTVRTPRHDVRAAYPWMYYDDLPGFAATIPERPDGVPLDTNLMVEVEDHAGRVRRGRHVSFRWEKADEGK